MESDIIMRWRGGPKVRLEAKRPVGGDDLCALADLAKIPKDCRDRFCAFIQYLVADAWDIYSCIEDGKSASNAFKKAAKAVMTLNDCLGGLEEGMERAK